MSTKANSKPQLQPSTATPSAPLDLCSSNANGGWHGIVGIRICMAGTGREVCHVPSPSGSSSNTSRAPKNALCLTDSPSESVVSHSQMANTSHP